MMSCAVRFARRFLNKDFYPYALLLICISSIGLTGCSGLVTANNTNPPPPALTISGVQPAAPTTTGFQVNWSTSLAASSAVDYGTTATYGSSTTTNTSMVTSHQVAVTGLSAGTLYHFRVRSKDAANTSASSPDMTFATAGDTTPPTVSVTAPATNATISGVTTASANATDNVGVTSVQFKVDSANTGAAITAAPYNYSLNTTALSNGNHILTAVASDAAGNTTTSAGVAVKVSNIADTTPPTVSITAPASGATVSGTVSVTANASDNVGVASVQFQLDGANLGALDTASPYSVSWNTTTATNGSHTLTAIAKDAAGNSTTSTAVTVTVNNVADTTAPSVPAGLSATAISSSQINLSWTASTDNVGVTGYNIYRAGVKIGTAPSTAYQDAGLNASTSYSYNVSAFDAAGNTSAQSTGASATTQAASSGGIPSGLGWYQIPNTQMINVCPSGLNCANVIMPWSGGIADTSRNRLIVWGGGHSDYSGNEVYALDLNALTINRLNNPSPSASSCVEVLSDGTPPSRHTYDGLAYITHADRMSSYTGSMAPTGCASQDTWTLNMSNLQWQNMNPAGANPTPNGGLAASDYDPNTKNVFIHTESWGEFASYNYDTNTMKVLARNEIINYYVTAVVDPKRQKFFMFGQGQAFSIDISGNDTAYSLKTLAASGCGFISPSAPGAAYDPVQDRIVGWQGGNTVYVYNPDTDSCTTVTYPNGPGAQQSLGTYGRFRYFPGLGVFALVNDASQNAYTLRLTSGSGTPAGPVVSAVAASSITTNLATINWTTDVGATSQVEYGTTTAYGTLTALNATLVTAHSVVLSGLSTGTLYHYRVRSKNASGVETLSGDFAVQTNSTIDTTPPTVSITAPASGATVSSMVTVSANATDNVAVASVQFALDGANLGGAVTSSPYQVTWNTTTAANGSHVLGAAARDSAGNVGNAVPVTVNVSNTGTTGVPFATRCTASGVVKCVAWDNASDFTPASGGGGYASGLYPSEDGSYQGVRDTTNTVDGAGSLKFVIRAGSVHPHGSSPAGYWLQQFGPDGNGTKFGEGSTFYMQFRLMLSPEMLNYNWPSAGGQGWKVFIVYGPIPGPSCTGDQFVQENTYQTNIATGYTSCSSPSLDTNNGVPPMLVEQGDYNCQYNSGYSTNPNCFTYPASTWITEYWVVHIGTYGQPNTSFQAWIAPDGQPLKQFINLPNFTFGDSSDHTAGLQGIILQPYFSQANGSTSTPAAAMWFDDLIISTQPIAAPNN